MLITFLSKHGWHNDIKYRYLVFLIRQNNGIIIPNAYNI